MWRQVARAGDLADWLVRKSLLHPAMRDLPVLYDMMMGGRPDPTTRQAQAAFEPLTLQLQRAAYRRALVLVQCAPISSALQHSRSHGLGVSSLESHPAYVPLWTISVGVSRLAASAPSLEFQGAVGSRPLGW